MPVFIRTDRGDLLTLSNRGEVLDTQLAATPQEANRVAIMMLASRYRRRFDLPPYRRRQPTRARSLRSSPAADGLVDDHPSAHCVNFVLT
jgi:hypothetical protein